MNKDIYYKMRKLDDAMAKALDALYDVKKAIDDDGKEKAWFDNGKIIVNGVEYPIENFTIEWKHSSLRDETD